MKLVVLALSLAFILSGCSALNATTEMNGKMDETNRKMDDTNHQLNEVERLGKFSSGMEGLMKAENAESLYPLPFDMVTFGALVGENATVEDLLKLTKLWVRQINKQDPPEDCTTDECLQKFHRKKMARYYSLWIMAGRTQQSKVQELVRDHYYGNSQYKRYVSSFLVARGAYIDAFGLKEDLLSQPMTGVGDIEAAIDQVSYLDYIVRLPFAEKLELKTILEDEPVRLDLRVTVPMWKRLEGSFSNELNQTSIDPNSATDDEEKKSRAKARNKAQELKRKVDAFVKSWS